MSKDNKRNDRKGKMQGNKVNRDEFKREVARENYETTELFKKVYDRHPEDDEKEAIKNNSIKMLKKEEKAYKKSKLIAFTIALFTGIFAGIMGQNRQKLLNPGEAIPKEQQDTKENDEKIEDLENEETVNEIAQTAVEKFKSELQDMSNYHYQSNKKQEIREEIESKNTKEDALQYLKSIFAEEYNRNNFTNIKAEDITISKSNVEEVGNALYKDVAENGQEIIRKTTKNQAEQRGLSTILDAQMMTVYINGHDSETATILHDKYVPVYNESEEVSEVGTNTLCKMGEIMQLGIIWKDSVDQDMDNLKKYEREFNFINVVTEYELSDERKQNDTPVMTAEDKSAKYNMEEERE